MSQEPEDIENDEEQEPDEVDGFNILVQQFLRPRSLDELSDDELEQWSEQNDGFI